VEVPEVEGLPVSQTFEIRFLFLDGEQLGSLLAEPRAVVFVPATTIKTVEPVYPEKLKNRGVQAVVEVVFMVTDEGEVVDPEIRFTSHPGFNEAALTAVSEWQFEPGLLDGVPVDSRMILPMIFNLNSRYR
jgi:TonB family protein